MPPDRAFWPEGFEGAVSLTFDDGLDTQLDNAIPCLDDCGLKGTFYVNPGRSDAWETQIPRWQQASRNGHELGNHTSMHPCSCNKEIVAYIKDAVNDGLWAVVCMHGIGGQHLSISSAALREVARFLDRNRNRIWTATMIEVADYIIRQRR